AVSLLAGCQNAPPDTQTPQLVFDTLPQISMNVARIEIVDGYQPPMKAPNVDHLFKQPPREVARRVLEKQLVANGSNHTLRVIIEDASVIKKDLPVSQGFTGFFSNEESEEYISRVSLKFQLIADDTADRVVADAFVLSERTQTLLEDSSPAERDMAFFTLDENIMQDLRKGIEGSVKRTFGWN
ncbi:MAG: Acyl-CoA synthetase (AMP-forming)/AMP-acid ligase, partial [Alphaproteobacteria bacterium]|nr:Acyl-CoA synthetase (AMP-forming)/AMP-acid ligase [Alphaproteobacteria bacterium]